LIGQDGIPSATLSRNAATYGTEATITVSFYNQTAPVGSSLSYNLAVQYVDGLGANQFTLVPGLAYVPGLVGQMGYIQTPITDANGIDEAYVAVQAVRNIVSTGILSTGELSNTVQAVDSAVPDPPRDLQVDYQYDVDPQKAILTWYAPYSANLTDVSVFIVYRSVRGGGYESLATIPYTNLVTPYTYTDSDIGPDVDIPLGSTISYYVTSVTVGAVESAPSNVVSFVTVEVSSAPRGLAARGQANTESIPPTQDVYGTFLNPVEVNGLVVYNYTPAYFVIEIYSKNPGRMNELIDSTTLDYVEGTSPYVFNFVDIDFFTSGAGLVGAGLYEVKCNLITYDNNGDELDGIVATSPFTSGPVPTIFDANGVEADAWSVALPLTEFKVRTAAELTIGNIVLIRRLSDNTISDDYLDLPTPTTDIAGNLVYEYEDINVDYPGVIVNIVASNAAGIGAKPIDGALV
jgi:hypothetical protein